MSTKIDTIIIGAGHSGLVMSYILLQAGREHLVLERNGQVGEAWRRQRWDSFALVIPNWVIRLPGAEYDGPYPDAFMPRGEFIQYLDEYASKYQMPIQFNTHVTGVEERQSGGGYLVRTRQGDFEAQNVIIAAGFFQQPKLPELASAVPQEILQLHTSQYRNPQSLPEGAVLVVGTGQSGCQIAEELNLSGRTVYQCVGKSGRMPRRYRGKDALEWLTLTGFLDRTVESLPNPQARFAAAPQLSGARGGHTLNLHQFARDGVHLLGHLRGIQDGKAIIAPDLMESLAFADRFEAEALQRINAYIAQNRVDAPEESLPVLRDGYESPIQTELDLASVNIRTVIWATGYRFDYSWVKPAQFDADGYPILQRGVSPCRGLYFIGLPWQDTFGSGFMNVLGESAAHILSDIEKQNTQELISTQN
jgi:putative flavoprotein involved in K+ transport